MSNQDFKPCPFCGNTDMANDEGCYPFKFDGEQPLFWNVRCGNPDCFASDASAETREGALEKWNRRAGSEDTKDAERYRKLKRHFQASFARSTCDYWVISGEHKTPQSIFDESGDCRFNLDMLLDAAAEDSK